MVLGWLRLTVRHKTQVTANPAILSNWRMSVCSKLHMPHKRGEHGEAGLAMENDDGRLQDSYSELLVQHNTKKGTVHPFRS
jgi:hypothetical protein